MLHISRAILDVGSDNPHIAPTVVGIEDVIGTIVPEHLAPPGESFIRLLSIDYHAEIPRAESIEGRIQLPLCQGFLVVQIPLDRIDCRRGIGSCRRIVLLDRHRMLKGNRERKPTQDSIGRFLAGFSNLGVDLGRLSILGRAKTIPPQGRSRGPIGDQHFFHQFRLGKEGIDEVPLFLSLLGKLGEPARSRLVQHNETGKLSIECVTG